MKITWLGHSAFRVEIGESIILLAPFLTGNQNFTAHFRASTRNATHILLTHGHDDHVGDTFRMWLEGQGAQKINPGNTGGKRSRHCEERSDVAIQGPRATAGLLRCACNDGGEAAL